MATQALAIGPAPVSRGGWHVRSVVAGSAALLALIGSLLLWGFVHAEPANAKAAIRRFSTEPSTTRAGGHPDVVEKLTIDSRHNQGEEQDECGCTDPRELAVHLPAGVIANPHVLSICTAAQAATFTCPSDSQAGFVVVKLAFGFSFYVVVPIFRTIPKAEQAALFFFPPPVIGFPNGQYVSVTARTGTDFGLDSIVEGLEHVIPVERITQVFWGVPARPVHDAIRFQPGEVEVRCPYDPTERLLEGVLPPYSEESYDSCSLIPEAGGVSGLEETEKPAVESSLPAKPFTQNPTTCVGPLVSTVDSVAYDNEVDHAEAVWPATTDCEQLNFDPSLSANPTTRETDSPAGMDVRLTVRQFQDPNTPSPSELRSSIVTLPEGFSLNPNAADGKTACSDAEANFGSKSPSHCPEFAKIGTDVLDSAALPGPIPGDIYIGEEKPGDRYRIIVTAGGFGTYIKMAGSVVPDPQTGRLVVSFQSMPQSPFQEFNLHFFGSERGLLATPERCGTYEVQSTFVPWASELSNQSSKQFFVLDSGPGGTPCPGARRPFGPTFQAGSEEPTAGVHSPFALRLNRTDGDQNLAGLSVATPPGFAATLKGIPYCPQSAIDQLMSPSYLGLIELSTSVCPAASLVGTAYAGAGAGSRPLNIPGKVYLAGPYKGEPLSLVVVIPAVSGPYDLGNVAVRVALHVDSSTAAVTATSDPLPQILEGIPLRTRSIQINLDRANFALNPTNCEPMSVEATPNGTEGAVVSLASHYQVANCADLAFGPKLNLRLKGGVRRRGHPAIRTVLRASPGEANIRRVSVLLPNGEQLDNGHLRTICTRVRFAERDCPRGSEIGSAVVRTPLLDQPLQGPIYLRSSSHKLPDLVLDLKGQLDIGLSARIDAVGNRLRTTFTSVPDAPISSAVLKLAGGKKGLLRNTENLCLIQKRATVKMTGQNRAVFTARTKLNAVCGSKASRSSRLSRAYKAKAVR